MKIRLHKNATTTPAQRAFIQNAPHLSVACLAEKTGVSKTTIRRWRNRADVFDRPHTPRRIKTALSPIDELKIVICRMAARTGLDDLHRIAGSFLGIRCSRASLNRCLKRYHISRLPSLTHTLPFDLKEYTGTYFYYTCFHLPVFSGRTRPVLLHTLLDCSFRMFHAAVSPSGQEFLARSIQDFPLRVHGIIHESPIMLVPGETTEQNQKQAGFVESQCRSFNLVAHHMDSPYSKTIQKLQETVTALGRNPGQLDWNWPGSTRAELNEQISRYNTYFTLGALKQKTPVQAMESHFTRFPNSFKQKPEPRAKAS